MASIAGDETSAPAQTVPDNSAATSAFASVKAEVKMASLPDACGDSASASVKDENLLPTPSISELPSLETVPPSQSMAPERPKVITEGLAPDLNRPIQSEEHTQPSPVADSRPITSMDVLDSTLKRRGSQPIPQRATSHHTTIKPSQTQVTQDREMVDALARTSSKDKVEDQESSDDEDELSFFSLVRQEFELPTHKDPSPGRTAARVKMFLALPYHLEQFVILGQLVCLNAFLFLLGFMPLRFVYGLGQLLFSYLPAWIAGAHRQSAPAWKRFKRYKCDVARGLMILISLAWLLSVKNAEIYHYIRGQSLMKLYVIFNMLYVFDRLLTSLGDDVIDSMYTSLEDQDSSVSTQVWHFALASTYCAIHSLMVLAQVITLNVAVNSDGNTLFVIVVSANFIELKSTVFKKYFHATMFQISCSDAVERFQAVIVMATVAIQNLSHMGLARVEWQWLQRIALIMAVIYSAEMTVDWIKHGFQNKFNHLPNYYRVFRTVICRDIAIFHSRRHSHPHFHCVARRFGCVIEPLGVVVLRALIIAFTSLKCSVTARLLMMIATLVCAMALKTMLTVLLLSYASKHLLKYSNNGEFNPLQPIRLPDDYMQATSVASDNLRARSEGSKVHHRRNSSITNFLASLPGASLFFARNVDPHVAAAALQSLREKDEVVAEPPTPRTLGGFARVTFNEPSPVAVMNSVARQGESSLETKNAAGHSQQQQVGSSSVNSKPDGTSTSGATTAASADPNSHRATADELGTWMSLGGFIPTAADKAKAAKNPLPVESVVRYNIYANKIPV